MGCELDKLLESRPESLDLPPDEYNSTGKPPDVLGQNTHICHLIHGSSLLFDASYAGMVMQKMLIT